MFGDLPFPEYSSSDIDRVIKVSLILAVIFIILNILNQIFVVLKSFHLIRRNFRAIFCFDPVRSEFDILRQDV